jgi:hypothetical protein
MITHLAARRYRCFCDWQQLELGQLTLIYGENGAGKSALLRVLPWLAATGRQGLPTLDLRWPGLRGAGWGEVCWSGRGDDAAPDAERAGWWGEDPDDHDPDLALGLRAAGWTVSWRLRRWDLPDRRWLDVLRAAQGEGPAQTLRARGRPSEAPTHGFSWGTAVEALRFDGLIPRSGPGGAGPALESVGDALAAVRWLGPRRVGPDRAGERRGLTPPPLDGDGAAAQAIALADPAVLERVSSWYQAHCDAEVARAGHGPESDRLVLRRAGRADLPFPDAGEGLQQAFPVLVGAEQLRPRGGLLAVEEPEVSLHPRLQRALADQLVGVARAQPAAQVLLETHSEVMLLSALQAAVEHGVAVRLHWVEAGAVGGAQVREVPLDAEGRPRDTTLTDAFDTMGVQRRALIDARRRRAAGPPRGGAGVG